MFTRVCVCVLMGLGRLQDMGRHPATSASVVAAQHWQTEEGFIGHLAQYHGPECHWRCSWQVVPLSMCVGKRRTFRATVVNLTTAVSAEPSDEIRFVKYIVCNWSQICHQLVVHFFGDTV